MFTRCKPRITFVLEFTSTRTWIKNKTASVSLAFMATWRKFFPDLEFFIKPAHAKYPKLITRFYFLLVKLLGSGRFFLENMLGSFCIFDTKWTGEWGKAIIVLETKIYFFVIYQHFNDFLVFVYYCNMQCFFRFNKRQKILDFEIKFLRKMKKFMKNEPILCRHFHWQNWDQHYDLIMHLILARNHIRQLDGEVLVAL